MSETANINLPYLIAGQAQKHVTHNEALRKLDAIVQLSVADRNLTTPPPAPLDGDRHIIAPDATGDWRGHDDKIAAYQDNAWMFYAPQNGWTAWVSDEEKLLVWSNGTWAEAAANLSHADGIELIGVNAAADNANRLTVKSDGVLFSHDDVTPGSGDQRTVVNKAATGNTASVLFQNNWLGHAEFGLIGTNDWALKYSANGSTWANRIIVNPYAIMIKGPTENGGTLSVGPHVISTSHASGGAAMEISANIPGNRYAFFDFHASDDQPDFSARFIRTPGVNGGFGIQNVGTGNINLNAGGNVSMATSGTTRSVQRADGFVPAADNAYSLGASTLRWSSIWAANGTIQTSDARDKIIEDRLTGQSAVSLVDTVKPALFRWKAGNKHVVVTDRREVSMNPDNPEAKTVEELDTEIVETSGQRLHAGFIAQELKAALDKQGLDFGAWGVEDVNDPESRQWLRPDQLIPVLWAALQETRAELTTLKAELDK